MATNDETITLRVTPPGYPTGTLCLTDVPLAVDLAGTLAYRGARVLLVHTITSIDQEAHR